MAGVDYAALKKRRIHEAETERIFLTQNPGGRR